MHRTLRSLHSAVPPAGGVGGGSDGETDAGSRAGQHRLPVHRSRDRDGGDADVTGTVKAVDDEGDLRVATVAITAAVDGKTVLARATARVRLPA